MSLFPTARWVVARILGILIIVTNHIPQSCGIMPTCVVLTPHVINARAIVTPTKTVRTVCNVLNAQDLVRRRFRVVWGSLGEMDSMITGARTTASGSTQAHAAETDDDDAPDVETDADVSGGMGVQM